MSSIQAALNKANNIIKEMQAATDSLAPNEQEKSSAPVTREKIAKMSAEVSLLPLFSISSFLL